jgi:hypothetical protein
LYRNHRADAASVSTFSFRFFNGGSLGLPSTAAVTTWTLKQTSITSETVS